MAIDTTTRLVRRRASLAQTLRAKVMNLLYPIKEAPTTSDPTAAINRLANVFSRYAGKQETAYDAGSAAKGATSNANLLQRQVERAISQVLGRSPGNSASSFITALNDAFPTTAGGLVMTTPSRGAVSMYSPSGNPTEMNSSVSAALGGPLSAEQATLYRQSSVIAGDALRVLEGLQSFAPIAESDRVEALRGLVRSEINSLVEEFGRVDEPRQERVETYFDALLGPSATVTLSTNPLQSLNKILTGGHLTLFGQRAFLDRTVTSATIADEGQIAGFELLKNYALMLRDVWNRYNQPGRSKAFPLFTERLTRARIMLSVIAEGNMNFMSAMDSIGYTENERRSNASKFTILTGFASQSGENRGDLIRSKVTVNTERTFEEFPGTEGPDKDILLGRSELQPRDLSRWLPDITVNDLNEWLDRYASIESPVTLSDSGQYGLEFVTHQADRIFWTLVPIAAFVKTADPALAVNAPILIQVLLHERVTWALDDLVNQFNALADLAA